jgi:uncharacterized protein (DUF2384 family)
MIAPKLKHQNILKTIPNGINDADVLLYLHEGKVNWEHVQMLKEGTRFKDEMLSDWLNVSVKTFRSYKKHEQEININIQEHVLLLLSLMRHGSAVFGSIAKFEEWLETEHFLFNGKAPVDYLKTITGIRFVEDRLTAMEYGDNV